MDEERLRRADPPKGRVVDAILREPTTVSETPVVVVLDQFLSDAEVDRVQAVANDHVEADGAAHARHDLTGHSFELPVDRDDLLHLIRDRIVDTIGIAASPATYRYRSYAPGDTRRISTSGASGTNGWSPPPWCASRTSGAVGSARLRGPAGRSSAGAAQPVSRTRRRGASRSSTSRPRPGSCHRRGCR